MSADKEMSLFKEFEAPISKMVLDSKKAIEDAQSIQEKINEAIERLPKSSSEGLTSISVEVAEDALIHLTSIRPVAMEFVQVAKTEMEKLEIGLKHFEAKVIVSGLADKYILAKGLPSVSENLRGAVLRGHDGLNQVRLNIATLKTIADIAEKTAWGLVNDEVAYTEMVKGKYKLKGQL